jgi:acyl CoA:acetate/3-ketoacid CoA transferase alpha subunit
VTCPFTGEQPAAILHPARRGGIHAQKADRAGNVFLRGSLAQKHAVLALRCL